MQNATVPTLIGLAPVLDANVRILVLGSFPGAASLAAGQYYAHPRNQFWRLISSVVGEDLAALPYAERLPRLLAHGVGLWDVLGECERVGSLDSAIRKPAANDFAHMAMSFEQKLDVWSRLRGDEQRGPTVSQSPLF